jgi:hypothetical protein
MTNPFAILGLPESLLLDPASIESAWREHHRDDEDPAVGNASDQNRARALLSDPVPRLAAWLEVKAPEIAPDRAIAPALMDLFSKIGPVLSQTDPLLARHRQATTALARALLTKDSITAQLAVQEMLQQIQAAKAGYLDRFADFEEAAEHGDFTTAAAALGPLKFLKKWEEQCRERLLALIAT